MTAPNSFSAYPNPPDDVRTRAVIMGDDSGQVQVIAQQSALLSLDSLAKATARKLRPLPYDVGAPTAAIPGHYGLPVIIDKSLTAAGELALATTEPGGYVRARGPDLPTAHFETRIAEFTIPMLGEPTNPSSDRDHEQIRASVSGFTTLRIQERLDETLHIPPLPEAARRVLALHADPNYELKDLVAIIETDPSMAARIMGWANSAFYHVDPPARSIDDAVMRVLGFDTVMSMALGMSLGQTLRLPDEQVRGLPPYWLDAIFTAATTEALARRMPPAQRPNTGLCYLAGLLGNFGTLVLGHVFPPHYQKICKLQEANRHLPHTYIDQYVLKLPREVLASTLLELWGVPQEAVDAVRYQFVADYQGTNATYVHLLHLARQALGCQGITDYPATAVTDADVESLGLSGSQLASVLSDINDSRNELDGFASMMG